MRRIALLILWTAAQVNPLASAIVAGRLVSTEGAPIPGVRMIALETAYPRVNIVSQAETDTDGRYRLESLPAGEYFIVADPFKIPSYYPGTGNRDDSTRVSVAAGAVLNGVDFKFVRSSGVLRVSRTRSVGETRLSGVIQNTQGKGVPNFAVALSGSGPNAMLWTVTDASGAFQFPSLIAGEFSMEGFAPVQEPYEDLRMPVTLHTDETLEQHVGVRRLGSSQERPDLYTPGDLRERSRELSQRGPGEPTFWRCQDPASQVQAEYSEALRAASVRGSVTVHIKVDPKGRLARLRLVSPDSNPELARAAVKAVSQWRFSPLKWKVDSSNRNTVSCNGEGDVREFQGPVTFDFPPR